MNLNTLIFYAFSVVLASCSITSTHNPVKDSNPEEQESTKVDQTLTFSTTNKEAILIGDNLPVFDTNLIEVDQKQEGDLVKVIGVSTQWIQNTKDYCDAYQYVKIETQSGTRLMDGRAVYQILPIRENQSFKFKNKSFQLHQTLFYGMGVSDENGLTFCTKFHEPLVLKEETSQAVQLVTIIDNSFSKKASHTDTFSYLELMENDGAVDSIQAIEPTETGAQLTLKRMHHETWNTIKIELKLDQEIPQAIYLEYGSLKDDLED